MIIYIVKNKLNFILKKLIKILKNDIIMICYIKNRLLFNNCYHRFFAVQLSLFIVLTSVSDVFCSNDFYIVNIEKVLLQSNAAHLGREHIKVVRTRLEQGYAELSKELSKLTEQQRQKEMQEAAHALNQQLELEKAAVNRVITNMMMEEIRTYRINNKIDFVLPKHLFLDFNEGFDITNQIIKAMNEKKPVFGKLPIIQVKKNGNKQPKK